MKLLSLGLRLAAPFLKPEVDAFVSVPLNESGPDVVGAHRDATFALAMQQPYGDAPMVALLRDVCSRHGIPTVFWTIEDPNSFATFAGQAKGFDLIATSDEEMIGRYRALYPATPVIWLPLAAQPRMHVPAPTHEDAADFVLLANWYTNDARRRGIETIVDPVIRAGYSLNLYAYAPGWPAPYAAYWRGPTSAWDVAAYYPSGKVALGLNNQAWGTAMTSMRTFEALACGKPFLSFHSDAYRRLGFENGIHFVWTEDPHEALEMAERLLGQPQAAHDLADRGRRFVLEHHTYGRRLEAIVRALGVGAAVRS